MTGILAGLAEAARDRPHVAATLLPVRSPLGARGAAGFRAMTFRQLDRRSDALAAGLDAVGAGGGARVALLLPPGEEFFVASFGLLKAGAVPVLIDPGIGVARLGRCLAEAEPSAFLGSPRAHLARAVLRWAPAARRLVVRRLERLGRSRRAWRAAPRRDGETAAILYTSGSTGPPKGVEYRHPHFAAQVESLRALYDLRAGDVSLATFPPFALFGPALGLTTVVPRMDPTRPAAVDPRAVLEAAALFDATVMFGSPALLDTVGRYAAATGARLPALRTVVSAGAPVPEPVIRDVVGMLADAGRVATPYGATEALPVSSIGSDELLALPPRPRRGVCVGRPAPGVDIRIAPVEDRPWTVVPDPLPDGEIGEIVVRGDVVTEAYRGRPEATALAKADWDGRRAHRMGDLGWLDDRGRLWFCGRVAHRVLTGDEILYPLPCEEVFAVHPAVARAALVGVGPRRAQRPVLCVELQDGARPGPALTGELLALGGAHPHTRPIQTVLYHPRFPVDIRHNAKVGYEALAGWAARTLDASPHAGQPPAPRRRADRRP
ncbi:MAG: AMP-binding protein [Euzebyaceae bacterium]|nr:AMP-binding protein [Euzebyaceae bacterium]